MTSPSLPIAADDIPHGASHAPGSEPAAGSVEIISFAIGDDQYGVDIMALREIKEWSDVTHLPRQPEGINSQSRPLRCLSRSQSARGGRLLRDSHLFAIARSRCA